MEELRIDPTIAYDVVELPTKGIFYKNNKKSWKIMEIHSNYQLKGDLCESNEELMKIMKF